MKNPLQTIAPRGKKVANMQQTHRRKFYCTAAAASLLLICLLEREANCLDAPRAAYSYQYPPAPAPMAQQQQQQQYLRPQHVCPSGAPLQWRPYLDASGKAYLAPAVVLASLKELSLSPIQLSAGKPPATSNGQQHQQAQYHPQDINNAGVNIYATFNTLSVLKSSLLTNISSTIRIVYRVSASLSTTTDLMQLAKSNTLSPASSLIQSATTTASRLAMQPRLLAATNQQQQQQQPVCSLELSEQELEKKVNRLFKKNQNYILYLDQKHQQPQQPSLLNHHLNYQHSFYYPFATHEPLNNQTSRALRRIFCKNCAQAPQVQLLNSTFVAPVLAHELPQLRPRLKLDCRVTGFPAPWIQWYRNGKLLRNRPGRFAMRTSKWRRKHNIRWSRLEIELSGARNETGIYECRAMNVVAREPSVGAYTLLMHPSYYALIPMQQPVALAADDGPTSAPTSGKSVASPEAASTQRPALTAASETTTTTTTPTTTPRPSQVERRQESSKDPATTTTTTAAQDSTTTTTTDPTRQQHQPVVGQSCPAGINDTYCMNKGTCVLIGHIDEKYCNCPEGYEGHRCESKSFGHKKAPLH